MNSDISEIKVSIPISLKLLKRLDNFAFYEKDNLFEFIERILIDYVENETKKRSKKEIELLNKIAVEQREEILENLEYQIDIFGDDSEE